MNLKKRNKKIEKDCKSENVSELKSNWACKGSQRTNEWGNEWFINWVSQHLSKIGAFSHMGLSKSVKKCESKNGWFNNQADCAPTAGSCCFLTSCLHEFYHQLVQFVQLVLLIRLCKQNHWCFRDLYLHKLCCVFPLWLTICCSITLLASR